MKYIIMFVVATLLFTVSFESCSGQDSSGHRIDPPGPVCEPGVGGGNDTVQKPVLLAELADSWQEAWLASPAVADLDEDDENEILVARSNLIVVWHLDSSVVFRLQTEGDRIWASPVVADLLPSIPGLEVAAAARDKLYAWDATGELLNGFPVTWQDEMRTLAAADIDDDNELELVAVSTIPTGSGDRVDTLIAINPNGTMVSGFPPHATSASGCDQACYITGGFDQNLALGDVDANGVADIFVTQDNAYLSLHQGDGRMYDAAEIFEHPTKFAGIRFLHDYDLAKQGWPTDPDNDLQAHFTRSAPAIGDVDLDGVSDLVVLGSVQNASQNRRELELGVALWVLRHDGTRLANWTEPFHVSGYLAGLWDYPGTNVVGATNQVSVADIFPDKLGPEFVFAGFDGRIHCVDAAGNHLWETTYTESDRVLTTGVLVVDLSADGVPEIIFSSYSPDNDRSALYILDAGGQLLHKLPLPGRGAMPVPTVEDVDGDGTLELVVSLKDGGGSMPQALVYRLPGSEKNCLLWPTGRGNLLRNGNVPPNPSLP